MKKNMFLVALAVCMSMALCPLMAQNVSKDYNLKGFTSITLQSVGDIIFTQSANYSCRVEGPAEYVEKTQVNVENGTLIISYANKKSNKTKNLKLYISAPDLSKVQIAGVGNFTANEILKLKNVTFQLNGVGNCNVKDLRCGDVTLILNGVGNLKLNVGCRSLNASVNGVGNITLSGKAETANLRRDGVGNISHKNLKCGNVTTKGWGL